MVELQLERDKVQEELEREVKSLRKQMASMEQETERQRSSLEEQIATLQETLSEVSWVPSAKESFLSTCSSSSSHLLPTSSPPAERDTACQRGDAIISVGDHNQESGVKVEKTAMLWFCLP